MIAMVTSSDEKVLIVSIKGSHFLFKDIGSLPVSFLNSIISAVFFL